LVFAIILIPIVFMLNNALGLLTAGFFFGTLLRDIRYLFRWKRVWPVVEDVIDWQRIDELLDSKSSSTQ
jgi:hypothetical protein